MRAAASANPLHYLVDAERALFAGDVASTAVVGGLVAAAGTAALGVWVGTRAMARAS
jgi:ABC-2 type transport system permease protein